MNIGVDIISNNRIERLITRWKDKFFNRILTSYEKKYCINKRKNLTQSLAGIFTAKEAYIKALNKKISYQNIFVKHKNNKPYINDHINISISHEKDYTVAICIC